MPATCHTVETPGEGTLVFLFSHNFSTINQSAATLFGFDDAQTHVALQCGLSDRLAVGLGRSSLAKTVDGFLKYRALRQSTGLLASAAIDTKHHTDAYDRSVGLRLAGTRGPQVQPRAILAAHAPASSFFSGGLHYGFVVSRNCTVRHRK